MATRIAINGFGRIGRLVFRALYSQGLFGKDIEVVAVGDIVPADNLAYLLKFDSTQGRFEGTVSSKKSGADFAATSAPTTPPAPARLSTITGWPKLSESFWATMRASWSCRLWK